MKKRVLSTILALAMVLSMFTVVTFADDTTTTVTYDTTAQYGWYNYLNVVNVIPDGSADTEGLYADLRADGTPYKIFLTELQVISKSEEPGVGADGSYMNSYMMTQEGYTDQKLYDYVQDTFGAYTYTLRGGKQLAYDMWNTAMPDELDLVYDNAGYTYVNEDAQTVYTQDTYHAALAALNTYLVNANDNYIFNVDNTGLGTYQKQKDRLAALETALANLEEPVVLIDLTDVTSANARLQMWIDTYNNIDVAEYKEKEEVQTWAKVLKAATEDPSTATSGMSVDTYEVDGVEICKYWETVVRNVVPQSDGLKAMANEIWENGENWPLGETITDLNQTTYEAEAYKAAYDQWANLRDVLRNQFATLKVSEALAELEELKSMIQNLEEVDLPYDAEQAAAYNNLKAYIAIYDGRVARITLDANKQLENYITLKTGVDRVHEIINNWDAGTEYATADEMYGLISKDVLDSCTLEDAWMALRVEVGLEGGLYTFVEKHIAEWKDSGLYTADSLATMEAAYMSSRDGYKDTTKTDADILAYIELLKASLVRDLVDLTGVTSENARLQMWIDTYNNIDVAEYKEKAEVQTWGAVLKAAAEDPSTATSGMSVDTYEVDGVEICKYWETVVRNVVPQSDGLKAMANEIWENGENWPLGETITDLNQTTYEAEAYKAAYDQWANLRDVLRNQFATLKVSEALAELEELKSMIQNLEEVDLPYDAEQAAAYNNLKAYIAIYDGRVARITLDANKQLENYITLKTGVDRVHEIINNWDAGTEYATADEMYGLISKDVLDSCTLEDAWMALRVEVGLEGGLYTFVEKHIAEWKDSGLYTADSLATMEAAYMSSRDGYKDTTKTDADILAYIELLKASLVEAEKPVVPGDTDGDGKASLCDIMLASRMVVDGTEFTADQMKACDLTGDGRVTLADLLKMARMLVENA